jgi:hypothetical protein
LLDAKNAHAGLTVLENSIVFGMRLALPILLGKPGIACGPQ